MGTDAFKTELVGNKGQTRGVAEQWSMAALGDYRKNTVNPGRETGPQNAIR